MTAKHQTRTAGRGRAAGRVPPRQALTWRDAPSASGAGPSSVHIASYRGLPHGAPRFWRPLSDTSEPEGRLGRVVWRLKRVIVGRPIPTAEEPHERLSRTKALAVFSSDALSSVAYATEEIMRVLVVGGTALMARTLPISLTIVALLAIIVVSYRQTIAAYPSGGGSYIVASDNLGAAPGLVAAAALLIDYVLTVAVSVAAGIAALTSLVPTLVPRTVELALGAVLLIMLGNIRGIRESGTIFAVPTYLFVATLFLLIGYGLVRLATNQIPAAATVNRTAGTQPASLYLLLSAFAHGCTAMTGTEAISNGVPAFKAPEARNARATLAWMGVILGSTFLGVSFLATRLGIRPASNETVLSQIGRAVFGAGPLWFILQVATALILVLAATTAFADFPRLASILARDRYLPRGFQFRGDRLAFTSGIVTLALLSALLLTVFHANLDSLIPLYAVGVFTSFTLSQAGMVMHWRRRGGSGSRHRAAINGLGAAATAVVTLIVVATKFAQGAWLVVLLIPVLVAILRGIHGHFARLEVYRRAASPADTAIDVLAVVPIADLGVEARRALAFARAIVRSESDIVAVHVTDQGTTSDELIQEWDALRLGGEFVLIESPYRSLMGPLFAYLADLRAHSPHRTLTVVIPEFVPSHWWENLLHNQTALRLAAALLFHPGIVVVSVPYRLGNDGQTASSAADASTHVAGPEPPRHVR
jgi:amino acid transporter